MEQRSVLQSDYERLRRERDNWKLSAISAIERAEKAEAEVERLRRELTLGVKWNKEAYGPDWVTDAPEWVRNAYAILKGE